MPREEPEPDSPNPSPPAAEETTPRPSREKGQRASSSTDSSGGSGSAFIGDPGPAFDGGRERPGLEQPEVEQPPDAGFVDLGWEEDTVRSILTAKGLAVHQLAGVGEQDWVYTEDDLESIAPPLTRILNRYDATRAAAATGDELAVMIGLGAYATRSYAERRTVLMEREDEPEVPVSGRAADGGGTGGGTARQGEPVAGAAPPPDPQAAEAEWRTGEQ